MCRECPVGGKSKFAKLTQGCTGLSCVTQGCAGSCGQFTNRVVVHCSARYTPPMSVSSQYTPPDGPLEVLHEDHEIIVVVKPDGLLAVPGRGEHLADCLLTRVQVAFPTALLVHRLDRDTSGVMVFAATPHAQRNLSMQFETRTTRKVYVARVAGQMAEKEGEIDLPIIVDWENRPRQMVCHETGKAAMTEWRAVKTSPAESRVRLMPKTGRTHQLRVHMAALGHPILGDPLYATGADEDHPRMMLHSQELRVNHPESGRGMSFYSKAPF